MIRGFLFAVFAMSASQAFAGVTAESFVWERSGRFFLTVTVDGNRTELKGNVRLGESADARQGAIAAQVKSYGVSGSTVSPVVSAIVSTDGSEDAFVVLIQADGDHDTKRVITPVAIRDRKATAARDLEFILNGLKSRKGWDALASFNWLQATGAGKQLFQIADKVETASDADIALPRPQPRTAEGQGPTVRTPPLPRDARGMDPNSLGGYPPPPPGGGDPRYAGRGQLPPIQDDDSQFSDGPRPPQDIQPPVQQQQTQPRRYRQPQQYQTDQYGYPLPPEAQGQGYPQQRYPQQQQQPRYPRGYAGNNGYGGNGGYPPPPPFGGGGFFGNLFQN